MSSAIGTAHLRHQALPYDPLHLAISVPPITYVRLLTWELSLRPHCRDAAYGLLPR